MENNTQYILSEYEEQIRQRRIRKSLRKIKTARYVLFIIAMLSGLIEVWQYSRLQPAIDTTAIISVATVVLYFAVFFISRSRPYISLSIASVVFFISYIYQLVILFSKSFSIDLYLNNSFYTIIAIIAISIRLILFLLLVIGAIHGRKFEQLNKLPTE